MPRCRPFASSSKQAPYLVLSPSTPRTTNSLWWARQVKPKEHIEVFLLKCFPLQGNHTNAGRFKVTRTSSKQLTVGRVLSFNEAEQLQVWQETNSSNSSCNRLRGTDGTIFAPLMRPHQGLWSYSAQLCRSLTPKSMGKTKYNKLPAQLYELSFGSPSVSEQIHTKLGKTSEIYSYLFRI